ncbi:MAG TPA: UvrD-helicase domain-containing protein [Burkholderiales bacterium]|nr:UvrD-helicase domain-containing protein [Burkholderiales bacterium]
METETSGQFNRIALDPARSVVVEACAGSGKTWLLVSRIFRLLLAGTAPAEILAITFTHKAAGEMRARLDDWLRYCAGASDAELREFLSERAIPDAELDDNLSAARGLFENVLTAQPGLNIYTFHAWFFDILRRAPLETGLAGHTLSEQTELLRQRAWTQFTRQLAQSADSPLAMAMQALLAETGLSNTRKLLQNFVYRRAEWWAYTEGQADPLAYAIAQLRAQIDIDVDRDIAAHCFDDPNFSAALLDYARGLAASTPARQNKSREILAVFESGLAPALRLEQLIALVLTQKGEINATFTPGKTPQSQALYAAHLRISEYLLSARKQVQSQSSFRYNERGLRLGAALLQHYQAVKREARVLDFADIEWQAACLLTDSSHAEYIQFKLDARYSHILLDEFQDTNPVQWRILQSWFEAAHQSRTLPKIFLVGDPKQSIYRFRGAQAGLFKLAGDYLTERGAAYLAQNCTRRNAATIIGAINTVFAQNANPLFQPHSGYDSERPGRVEVLPLARAPEPETGNANRQTVRNPLLEARPLDKPGNDRHREAQLLVRRIQEIIALWAIDDGKGGKRRPKYSDIMILVRSRTHLQTYEAALKAAQIPYIGNRRGGLLDSMEIGDILSLLQFLGSPHSDLALARVLRSPLFSCTDDELMALRAAQIQTQPRLAWWPALLALPQPAPALRRAIDLLQNWIALAARIPVHDLLDRIYFEANVPARYRAAVPAALQNSVVANLAAFMELTLTLGGGRYPSLHRFLTDIATLRRDAEENPDEGELQDTGNAVRIFTVHGAKGLEAPIVWLLDAGPRKPQSDSHRVLFEWKAGSYRPGHFSLLSTQENTAEFQLRYLEREAVHAAQENLNLLYVAMTRSRQALLVSGVAGSGSQNWHQTILSALAPDCSEFALGDDLRADCAGPIDGAETAAVELSLPADIGQPRNIGVRNNPAENSASDFGTLVHALLEFMIPPAAIGDEAELRARFGNHPRFDAALQLGRSIVAQDHLQRFFDPVSYLRAHNELVYLRNNGSTYRIDRVVEFEREVWLLDYKTGHSGEPEQLAAAHGAQLQEYRSAMRICYPDKTVFCALIDRAGKLIVVPAENPG